MQFAISGKFFFCLLSFGQHLRLRVQEKWRVLLLLLLMLVESVVHRNFTVVFCWENVGIIVKSKWSAKITHLIPCETFPAPSNDVIAIPALPDAVAEGAASVVDEFEVSAACIWACFGLCRGDGFQVPGDGNFWNKLIFSKKVEWQFPELKLSSDNIKSFFEN
jgi:hypothetical protein